MQRKIELRLSCGKPRRRRPLRACYSSARCSLMTGSAAATSPCAGFAAFPSRRWTTWAGSGCGSGMAGEFGSGWRRCHALCCLLAERATGSVSVLGTEPRGSAANGGRIGFAPSPSPDRFAAATAVTGGRLFVDEDNGRRRICGLGRGVAAASPARPRRQALAGLRSRSRSAAASATVSAGSFRWPWRSGFRRGDRSLCSTSNRAVRHRSPSLVATISTVAAAGRRSSKLGSEPSSRRPRRLPPRRPRRRRCFVVRPVPRRCAPRRCAPPGRGDSGGDRVRPASSSRVFALVAPVVARGLAFVLVPAAAAAATAAAAASPRRHPRFVLLARREARPPRRLPPPALPPRSPAPGSAAAGTAAALPRRVRRRAAARGGRPAGSARRPAPPALERRSALRAAPESRASG